MLAILIRRYLCGFSLLFCVLVVFSQGAVAEDDFANAIEIEAQKMDGVDVGSSDEGNASKVGREEFNLLLEEEFHGSWVFFQKLPESTRSEIYQEYKRTGSIRSARRMIMNRFLNK